MKNLTHSELLKLSDNKIIFYIDLHYRTYFLKIVNNITRSFKGIPEEPEDIYWEFMFLIPSTLRALKITDNQPYKTVLGIKCRYFTFNKCRSLSTRSHEVMNYAGNLDESDVAPHYEARDSHPETEITINLTLLSPIELEVFTLYFVENQRLSHIARKLKLTLYKTTQIYELIIAKLKEDLKRSGLI